MYDVFTNYQFRSIMFEYNLTLAVTKSILPDDKALAQFSMQFLDSSKYQLAVSRLLAKYSNR